MTTKRVAKDSFQALLKISYLVEDISDDPKVLRAVIGNLMNYYGCSPENAVDGFLSDIELELSSIRSRLEEAASNIQREQNAAK